MKQKRSYLIVSFIIIILLLILCFLCVIDYYNFKIRSLVDDNNISLRKIDELSNEPKFSNSGSPVKLNIEYGFNQGTHPKVLYFEDGFNGYKFYMAYTPYYKAQDEYENPTIAVSNDGTEWTEITDNPIDTPRNFKKGVNYNSDTHLVYNSDTKELECYWRYVEGNKVIIYRRVTKDGVNFEPKEVVLEENRNKMDFLSPAIIYEDETYKMWYVDLKGNLGYTESKDLKNWSNYETLKTNYNDKTLKNWHLDVIKDKEDYKMVMSGYYEGHNHVRMNLYYSNSKDGKVWSDFKVILTPTYATSNWDNMGIYRSSLVKVNGMYYLYYSGINSNEDRNIGLIEVNKIEDLFFD